MSRSTANMISALRRSMIAFLEAKKVNFNAIGKEAYLRAKCAEILRIDLPKNKNAARDVLWSVLRPHDKGRTPQKLHGISSNLPAPLVAQFWEKVAECDVEELAAWLGKHPRPIVESLHRMWKSKLDRKQFYDSDAWRQIRYQALKREGGKCQCCGVSSAQGAQLHVDHIKPRSKYPGLELEITNLQVLCRDCNLGKGAWDETDWRRAAE